MPDAKVVRELLTVKRNVEFYCTFLLRHGAQIGHQPILGGTMGKNLDLAVQFESLHFERTHTSPLIMSAPDNADRTFPSSHAKRC